MEYVGSAALRGTFQRMASEDRERWDRRFREGSHTSQGAPVWLEKLGDELPRKGRALDVASGAGRVACWLAQRGLQATAVDVSPEGLKLTRELARAQGLELETLELDLEQSPLPSGPFALVSCFAYLQRDLFPRMRERLELGGVLVCELSTLRNLERHPRPGARFLLESNELLTLCAPLEIVYYREGWIDDRSLARLVARRSVSA